MTLLEKFDNFEEKEKENKVGGRRMSLPPPTLTLKQRDITGQISVAILEEAKSFSLKPLVPSGHILFSNWKYKRRGQKTIRTGYKI